MQNIGPTEWIIILLIVVVLFGAKKIPDLAKGIGQGIKEFKKGMKGNEDEEKKSENDNKNEK